MLTAVHVFTLSEASASQSSVNKIIHVCILLCELSRDLALPGVWVPCAAFAPWFLTASQWGYKYPFSFSLRSKERMQMGKNCSSAARALTQLIMRSECRQECVEEWSWQGFTSLNYSKPIPSPVKPFFFFLSPWRCFMEMFLSEHKIQALSATWANSSWQDIALAMSFGCAGLPSTASFAVVISEQLAFLCYVVGLLDAGTHQIGSLKGSQIILDANLNLKNKQKNRERGGQSNSAWVIQTCLHPDLQKIQLDPFVTLKSTQWEETLCKLEQPKQNRQAEAQCAEQAGKAGFANALLSRRNMHKFLSFFFSWDAISVKNNISNRRWHPSIYTSTPLSQSRGAACVSLLSILLNLWWNHTTSWIHWPTVIWLWLKWVLEDDGGLGAWPQKQSNARCLWITSWWWADGGAGQGLVTSWAGWRKKAVYQRLWSDQERCSGVEVRLFAIYFSVLELKMVMLDWQRDVLTVLGDLFLTSFGIAFRRGKVVPVLTPLWHTTVNLWILIPEGGSTAAESSAFSLVKYNYLAHCWHS